MPNEAARYLVVGISSRALFNLDKENQIFDREGLKAFREYQITNEDKVLEPGCGFPLVKAILHLNETVKSKRSTEVVIMSRNGAETSLRIFKSIEHYGLDISRAALTGGESITPYLRGFGVDLFLSQHEGDVQAAADEGIAAALLYAPPPDPSQSIDQIRIAFDGDAVIFSDEAERIYQAQGLEAFIEHEKLNASNPLPDGPFAKLLRVLSFLQSETGLDRVPVRTALVTARNSPSHERVIRTLQVWKVNVDECFFLGGLPKDKFLAAFRPHMFFDDQPKHCDAAARVVPTGRVFSQRSKKSKAEN